ncbi:hypothetical protein [Streptomyces globisporus]
MAGHRSLLIDLLGHGLNDRPTDFDYPLESHADALTRAGVSVVPVPHCGHNIMLDNPQGFVRATAAALALPEGI